MTPLVMLVDGTAEAEHITSTLKGAGVRLLRAADTIAAESLFVANLPSLIVLSLDDEGASAFCDLISAIPRGSAVPVILVGGQEALRAPIEAILRGAYAFISRPVEAEALLEQVDRLLAGSLAGQGVLGTDGSAGESSAELDEEQDETFRVGTREPTQILDEPTSPADALLDRSFGFSMSDLLAENPLDFGFGAESESGPLPWEVQLEVPPPGDEDEVDVETNATDHADTHFEASDGSASDELPSFEHPAPWLPLPGDEPVRPERTQVLSGGRSPLGSAEEGEDLQEGGVTELSADFRRVIDEVAQRLFPEASPEEYQDEHFDELRTVVPYVGREAVYDDHDEYSLDAMETFTMGQAGLTLSAFDGAAGREGEDFSGDTRDEGETGAAPTQQRSVSQVFKPAPSSAAASAPPLAGPLPRRRAASSAPPTFGSASAASVALELDGELRRQGELATTSVPRLLAACLRGGFEGQLTLRPSKKEHARLTDESLPRRTILFSGGHPAVVTSGLVRDRLVERLHRQGRLNEEQRGRVRAMIDASGRRAGAILIELGLLGTEELFPLIRWHFQEILFACFSWREGSFWLEPAPEVSPQRVRLEPEGPTLLLEGLRRRSVARELEALLGGPSARLRLDGDTQTRPERAWGLLEGEGQLLELCDGARTLGEILAEVALERGQALSALYGLSLLGVVGSDNRRDRRDPGREGSGEAAALERARLEQRIRLCGDADYFSLLGVSTEASPYEIRKAHETISRQLAPGRLAAIDATDLDHQLEDLRFVIDEALEVLTDDELREAYRQARF